MTVRELYNQAIIGNYPSLVHLIEWLIHEKRFLTMDRDARNIEYLMNHPTKNIWSEASPYIAKRKGLTINGTSKTNSAPGA
ncbi:hypothetical protein [Salipaludibacillus sp. CF4.18]|uniref:hypothetical protein n=1 Tax=Salipaludibacillus sp. CF4.18 TaxID=3373081 RepID=UPI003EE4A05B